MPTAARRPRAWHSPAERGENAESSHPYGRAWLSWRTAKCLRWREKKSGAEGSRTLDLLNAIQALSQLSYGPTTAGSRRPPPIAVYPGVVNVSGRALRPAPARARMGFT